MSPHTYHSVLDEIRNAYLLIFAEKLKNIPIDHSLPIVEATGLIKLTGLGLYQNRDLETIERDEKLNIFEEDYVDMALDAYSICQKQIESERKTAT